MIGRKDVAFSLCAQRSDTDRLFDLVNLFVIENLFQAIVVNMLLVFLLVCSDVVLACLLLFDTPNPIQF